MAVVLCPGVHLPGLTQKFLAATDFTAVDPPILIYPTEKYPPFSAAGIRQFLAQHVSPTDSLVLIAFSAGVVGAIGAAQHWHYQGRTITALIALDGWGVPLSAPFPVYRLSHDRFTHWSSAWLGTSRLNFYADPPVAHLDLWRSPHQIIGWQVDHNPWGTTTRQQMTAAQFVRARVLRSKTQSPQAP
ncbi:MAG: hypothetical protein AAFW84_00755 [Cyanobacteria bacterium J06635_15]